MQMHYMHYDEINKAYARISSNRINKRQNEFNFLNSYFTNFLTLCERLYFIS